MRSAAEADGADRIPALRARLEDAHLGDPALLELLLAAILADGHVLLEGAPGLGKTRLVRALADAMDLRFRRIQGTPDLMPGDVTGSEVLDENDGLREFRFVKGPVFCNMLLVDEINRATPRTQAALLEAMEERQVSSGTEVHELPRPFLVCATQNPIELEGTYPLPEAQLDRFLFLLEIDAPDVATLESILRRGPAGGSGKGKVLEGSDLLRLQQDAAAMPVADPLIRRVAELIRATHPNHDEAPVVVRENVAWGASPRAGLATLAGARGLALLRGREHVTPEDLRDALRPAMRHRVLLRYEARAAGLNSDDILDALLEHLPLR